ncbi:BUD22 [Candida jiufengensis]|uniref:BUD22 n=1 Tax=Candida jiufengensis TaxID=497108 RepID=UPI0022258FF0|nr:BUD22 [Candida jiufengensis]KAI5950916.1 BUD22 [Candida jiufengensis]
MWKLDLLEAKYEDFPPRFPHTKKLLFALKHNNKLIKKLPTNKEDAQKEILELKTQFFENKYHSAYKKLEKEINKIIKLKSPPSDEFKKEEFINQLITSKLIKSITTTILLNKQLKSNPPEYIPNNLQEIIKDKSNPSNPSQFFIKYCQKSKDVNNYCSNIWNNKNVKTILQDIEWSFKMVRGNLSNHDIAERSKQTGKEVNEDKEDEEDEENEDTEEEDEVERDDHKEEEHSENESDIEEQFEKYAAYDNLEGASDEEDEENGEELNSNINYNEVTDEEPSEEEDSEESSDEESDDSVDDFFEEEPPKKKAKKDKQEDKYELPELAQGYYSGGSDDEDEDVDNDKVVKEITQQRKNRRGQRARQKIWAQKYGKSAKHIVKDIERVKSEREKRQEEFEERQRKRELKAKLALEKQKPTGSNSEPLGERKSVTPQIPFEDKKIHPSWEAKKQAEEKLKNVKFQGKKITFD